MVRKNTRRAGMKTRHRGPDECLLSRRQSSATAISLLPNEIIPDIAKNMNNKQNKGDTTITIRKVDKLVPDKLPVSEGETGIFEGCRTEQPSTYESHEVGRTDTLNTHRGITMSHAHQPGQVIEFGIYHDGQSNIPDTHQEVASSSPCECEDTTTFKNQDGEIAIANTHEEIEQVILNAYQPEPHDTSINHKDGEFAISDSSRNTAISHACGSKETTTPKTHQDKESPLSKNNPEAKISTIGSHPIHQTIGLKNLDAEKSKSLCSPRDSQEAALAVHQSGSQKHEKNDNQKRKLMKEPFASLL